jgi:hypothetical protein
MKFYDDEHIKFYSSTDVTGMMQICDEMSEEKRN